MSENTPGGREEIPLAGPQSENLSPRLVYSPPEYRGRCDGPVKYVLLANPIGVFGCLWASDEEGAVGLHMNKEQGDVASNKSYAFWLRQHRAAYERGLSPTEFLAEAQAKRNGAWPYPGAVLPGEWGEAQSLDELPEKIVTPSIDEPDQRYLFSRHFPEYERGKGFVARVTNQMRRTAEQAKPAAGERLWFAVDQHFPLYDRRKIPVSGYIGLWRIRPDGSMSEFEANPKWKVTAKGMGFDPSVNDVELEYQRLRVAKTTAAKFLEVLRGAEVCYPLTEEGRPLWLQNAGDGKYPHLLEIATREDYAPKDWPGIGRATVEELTRHAAPSSWVRMNRGYRLGVTLPVRDIGVNAFG